MSERDKLSAVVAKAWRSFDSAASLKSRVIPAIPILFFGDLDAYVNSQPRVLTVGLNPSQNEFPEGDPFQRFPLAEEAAAADRKRYLDALSAYFRTRPYAQWFNSFEPLLNGMGASYYDGQTSTVLHTDICSPIATDPTWSQLGEADRRVLVDHGGMLWHELLVALQPNVVLLSVAKSHLDHIWFDPLGQWEPVHTFNHKADGASRKHPYRVRGRWHLVGDEPALLVFCPASQTPLGSISTAQKRELGAIVASCMKASATNSAPRPSHGSG